MFSGSITTPGGAFTPYPSNWAQFAADPANAQALQGYQQVMAMMQQAGGFMPFAYPEQEAARRRKGKAIAKLSKTRDLAFKRLGDKEDGPHKSAKLRIGPEMGQTSAMERLGGSRPALSRRSRESETIRLDEEEAESQPRASAYTRLSYDEDDLDKIGSVARKLRALEEKVEEKAGAKKHTLAKSPFSARVHAHKLRRKIKLDVEKFTGKEDPNVHLDTFHNAAQMVGCTDAECLLFFLSLRGRQVEWFNRLPHGKIRSFEKLAEIFRKKYQDNCTKRKKFTYLNTVGQREKESLTQFLTRWRDEVDKVEEMDDKTAMSLLMNAFRSGDLYTEFYRRPPSFYQEAYNTAWEYADAEVLNKSKRELKEGYTRVKTDKPKKDDHMGGSKPRATYGGMVHQIRDEKKREPKSDGKNFPSMGMGSLSPTNFQNHAKQRWEVLPIAVKALVQHQHKAERPYPAMGNLSHRWEPSDGKAKPSMGRHDRWKSFKVDKGEEKARIESDANTEEIQIDTSYSKRKVRIGADLQEELRTEIVQVLTRYKSLFAWSVADMPGIDRSVICHCLSILEGSRPVRQKKRFLASERRDFVKKEVKDLLKWDDECARAFEELKTYLTSDIVLSKPETKETLYLYLGVTQMAVSSVLMRDDGVQRPIYYVSKALNGAESRSATYYHLVSNVIRFARFGMDIIGAFPQAQGGKKYVMVAIDYFTKWVEAEAYATITTKQCQRFVWKNIITRFGSSRNIVTDNGPQFRNLGFTKYLEDFGITHNKASIAYPQGNGQVESANRTIVDGIKKRLGEARTNWLEELPHIIWAYRVTSRRATGETPFVLTYPNLF
ncbi:unnamed protein product [Cuscuta campestris]|uniref:Integrase catalytic domain-containing protein n=1 Tax=Cuscuta campestris TaxID=132261 RepID=A0A484LP79_9ASTE|nr:unnamed protein product [Cuscuta campestris]